MSEANGQEAIHEALVVELEEVGGEPVVFEVERYDEQRVAILLSGLGPDGDAERVRLIAAPEDLCHEIDAAAGRISRAPVVDPTLDQEFSAPFDLVVVAHRLDEIPVIKPSANIDTMSRTLRAVRAMENGSSAFDVSATLIVPKAGGAGRGFRGGVSAVAGNEVTLTAMRMVAQMLRDAVKAIEAGP